MFLDGEGSSIQGPTQFKSIECLGRYHLCPETTNWVYEPCKIVRLFLEIESRGREEAYSCTTIEGKEITGLL